MTWQAWAAPVLTVLSLVAQLIALDEVRAWAQQNGQSLARRLRTAWRWLTARFGVRRSSSIPASSANITMTVGTPTVYTMPSKLRAQLASYIEAVKSRIDGLQADAAEHARRLEELEARAEQAAALAAEQAANARLASAWVIAGAVLAILALLAQVMQG